MLITCCAPAVMPNSKKLSVKNLFILNNALLYRFYMFYLQVQKQSKIKNLLQISIIFGTEIDLIRAAAFYSAITDILTEEREDERYER